ncbi:MAG: HAD hydrolase-like protein [Sedimentisphaerales bacterium]|nr:HAD hydrolase-like protein [Sedimentisphaerales bacterium]
MAVASHTPSQGIDAVLVLSGITKESDLDRYPYRPDYIFKDVGEIAAAKQ